MKYPVLCRFVSVILLSWLAAPVAAQVVANPDAVRSVAPTMSVQLQTAALRQSADSMRILGTQKLPEGLTDSQVKEAKQYQAWLVASAKRLNHQAAQGDKLAKAKPESLSSDASQDYSRQSLQLQAQLQQQGRTYSTIAKVLKTKHETAKSMINNVR